MKNLVLLIFFFIIAPSTLWASCIFFNDGVQRCGTIIEITDKTVKLEDFWGNITNYYKEEIDSIDWVKMKNISTARNYHAPVWPLLFSFFCLFIYIWWRLTGGSTWWERW